MKRKIAFAVLILLVSFLQAYSAYAENVSGSTAESKTFFVSVTSPNAYIELSSYKGTASVHRTVFWFFSGFSTSSEDHYGFYKVSVLTDNASDAQKFDWVPSSTTNYHVEEKVAEPTFKIYFPHTGDYTVFVSPIHESGIQRLYWKEDKLEYWIKDATWRVTNSYGCSVSNQKSTSSSQTISGGSSSVSRGTVTIYYYKDGNYYDSQTMTISNSQYIYPKTISGYTCTPNNQYVSFDSSTGKCSPNVIQFNYTKNNSGGNSSSNQSVSTGAIVTPYDWDTQFKPGTATAICDGKVDNENKYKRLPNLYDNNASTSFWWLIWKSERTDNYPEVSALFNSSTVSSVGIRNGNTSSQSEYNKYARVRRFRVQIHYSGGVRETYITLNDNYSRDYQKCSLGSTYSGVTRIDFFLDGGGGEGFYTGNSETYYIHISDMQFYN